MSTSKEFRLRDLGQESKSLISFVAAITLSGVGSQISSVALPLVAILTLNASPLEIGALGMLLYLPVLFITPFAGVLADKYPPKLINALADLCRGAAVLAIPLLALVGALSIPTLYVITFIAGVLKALADVAHHSMLPSIISPVNLDRGNTAVNSSYSVTEVAGPGLGGILVQIFGAPLALLTDALSFFVSGILILRMKTLRTHVDRTGSNNWFSLVGLGFRFLFSEPRLLWLGICGGVSNLMLGGFITILSIFMIRSLSLEAWVFGAVLAIGALGGVAGALMAGRVRALLPLAQTLLLAEFIGGLGVIVIGLANIGGSAALTLTMALLGMFVHSIGMGVYNVHSMSTRQRLAPPQYLGRVTASYRLLSHGAIPLGAIVGGLSMDLFGGVTTMVAIGTLVSLWAVVLRFTPFMRLDGIAPTGASA